MLSMLCFAVIGAGSTGSGSVSGKVALDGSAKGPVVVYIEKVQGSKSAKEGAKAEPSKLAQKDSEFAPYAIISAVGQKVEFQNQDAFYHNVFSPTPGNQFDLGLYRGGVSKIATMKAPGEVDIFCNIHPDMSAKILVLENDFYAVVAADGSYTIASVPDGHYTLVAWAASHEPVRREIDVKKGDLKSDFSLKPRKTEEHLNKNGESYGRYK